MGNNTFDKLSEYGNYFQVKVIAALTSDKKFLQTVYDVIQIDYFDNQAHKWLVETTIDYFHKYHTNPDLETLSIELKKIDNEVLKLAVTEQIKDVVQVPTKEFDYVKEEFTNFCRNQKFKKALLDAVPLLNRGEYDEIRFIVNEAQKAGRDKSIGLEYKKDVEQRYREDARKTVPSPWKVINDLLQGGIGGGDLGLIFGGPGSGKSWLLIAWGAAAVKAGYNVLHYTLELGENYVGLRYDSVFTGIDVSEMRFHRKEAEKAIKNLKGNLVVAEFGMGTTSIEGLKAHYQQCVDEGFEPDLIMIDYVDLLKSSRSRKERKEEIDDNYTAARAWAKELDKPILSPSQVNRSGAKDNVVEGDKAAGSYDKMMIADFSMSLSRKKEDKVANIGRGHVMKNRYGRDGMTYKMIVDTSNGHIEFLEEYNESTDKQSFNGNIGMNVGDMKDQFAALTAGG